MKHLRNHVDDLIRGNHREIQEQPSFKCGISGEYVQTIIAEPGFQKVDARWVHGMPLPGLKTECSGRSQTIASA